MNDQARAKNMKLNFFSKLLCPLKKSFDGAGMNSSYALGWQRAMYDLSKHIDDLDETNLLTIGIPSCQGVFYDGWSMSKEEWMRGWHDFKMAAYEFITDIKKIKD